MKKILFILIIVVCALKACEDVNSIHNIYLDKEIVYIGKVDSVEIFPGRDRVLLKWRMNADPKINKCNIFWNNKRGHHVVDINRVVSGPFDVEEYINIPEGNYLFEFITEDKDGNLSLSVFKSGQIYGDIYMSNLRGRPISNISKSGSSLEIEWVNMENSIGVVFNYLDSSGDKATAKIEPDENITIISDFLPGGEFEYQTMFLPEPEAIDVFYSETIKGNFPE